jgi:N-acetylglucosaminyldiphosphoundecaprenol N-acetyl-beta-D-mannosaminyltransferase
MSANGIPRRPSSLRILGTRVDLVTITDAVTAMERWIDGPDHDCRFVVNTGFHGLWTACRDPEFHDVLASADLFTPDGIAPIWIGRMRRRRMPERVTGADIMQTFFTRAVERGYSNYFLGDTEETLAALEVRVGETYPGLRIAGTYSPPFRPLEPAEEKAMIDGINAARPDVVWVGLGLPKQERWIHKYRQAIDAKVAVGVGANFGFLSGRVARSPEVIGRMGLEWAWRLAHEPRKLWRRVFLDGPQFMFHVGLEQLGLRRY